MWWFVAAYFGCGFVVTCGFVRRFMRAVSGRSLRGHRVTLFVTFLLAAATWPWWVIDLVRSNDARR